MTQAQLEKIKELDIFLKERNMDLEGSDIMVGFNVDKSDESRKFICLNLNIGKLMGYDSVIVETGLPIINHRYYIKDGGEIIETET